MTDLICPECGESRPDDERVKAGMKCFFCSYSNPARPELSEGDESDGRNEIHIQQPKRRNE